MFASNIDFKKSIKMTTPLALEANSSSDCFNESPFTILIKTLFTIFQICVILKIMITVFRTKI